MLNEIDSPRYYQVGGAANDLHPHCYHLYYLLDLNLGFV